MRETAGAGLRREFTTWSAGALAFAFISPIVALYSIFGFAFAAGGPAAWWAFPIVLAGQVLVALAFGELASRWPLEGSVYQWSRRLAGRAFGWFTGWAYVWTLVIAVATVSYGAAGFIPPMLGIDAFSSGTQLLVALGVLAVVTFVNTLGRRWLKLLVVASVAAELIGSIGIGTVLLLFHREHDLSVLFETFGAGEGPGGYVWSGMLAAIAFVGWSFVGFESAGSIAEEVRDPRRAVPKAMLVSIVLVAVVIMYSALTLILAIPDIDAVLRGEHADPVAATITAQLGEGVTRPLFALFVIGFIATLTAVQAAASRMLWSVARDGGLPGSRHLTPLSERDGLPVRAIVTVGALATLIVLTTQTSTVYATLVTFTTGGFYLAFSLPLVAATVLRLRGGWSGGPFSLGRWGAPVLFAATAWTLFQLVNIAWPRAVELPWHERYAVILMAGVLLLIGLVLYPLRRRHLTTPPDEPVDADVPDPPSGLPRTPVPTPTETSLR